MTHPISTTTPVHKGRDKTRLVGNVFHPQEMGFAVTPTTRYGNASTGLF